MPFSISMLANDMKTTNAFGTMNESDRHFIKIVWFSCLEFILFLGYFRFV